MDEGTLNDLLECSVCLERLDTSSKVLPCQHTFCKKCLREIVESHKELRCPECRILVPCKVDELPPNVLLMRILEGMKNAAPKKNQRTNSHLPQAHGVTPGAQPQPNKPPLAQQNLQHSASSGRHKSNKQQLPAVQSHPAIGVPQPAFAKALFDYTSLEPSDLSFKQGDMILLHRRIDSNWYQGECGGKRGIFPLNYVQVASPIVVSSHVPLCRALYDFRMHAGDDEGCLSFRKGDVMTVIRRVDENWAEGKMDDGRIGIFPLPFVELNGLASSLMKLSTNSQPGPSRLAPPTPTQSMVATTVATVESAPLIPTDHTHTVQAVPVTISSNKQPSNNNPLPSTAEFSSTSSSSSSSATVPTSSSSASSSSTAPSSPASPPPRTVTGVITTGSPSNTGNNASLKRLSADASIAYVAMFPYKPQKPDELELRRGCIYLITERCQDGWFKGISNRTQRCGVFPGNYVMPVRDDLQPVSGRNAVSAPLQATNSGRIPSTGSACLPPELPPRSASPNTPNQQTVASDKSAFKSRDRSGKDKVDKVSLMRRLASMKRSKSPPDAPTHELQNMHARSGSCPSQLLPVQQLTAAGTSHASLSASQRLTYKERPSILPAAVSARSVEEPAIPTNRSGGVALHPNSAGIPMHQHRKSQSLDTTLSAMPSARPGSGGTPAASAPTCRERYRCIAPYPPNSEYELELQVNDIVYVHKKRDDGWFKGTQPRTGRTGLFPASFVEGHP